jgi:CHAT domain/SIR2-like domain
MHSKHAYLEIGLRWRGDTSFDVTMDLDDPEDTGDRRAFGEDPIEIEPSALDEMTADEVAYGRYLTRCILSTPRIRAFFDKARSVVENRGVPLHLRLFIDPSAPARFHSIRWESLRDPADDHPVATKHDVYMSRFLNAHDWRRIAPPPKHDLRALTVIADPSDITRFGSATMPDTPLTRVDLTAELDRARAALEGMHVTELASNGAATLTAIADALEQGVDILYLVCHGTVTNGEPRLYLEEADGTTAKVDGSRFVQTISELRHRPTLAVLCSCGSAGGGDEDRTVDGGSLGALGPRLTQAGIAAVVAMQGDITMRTAERLLPRFFSELGKDGLVDRALALARSEVSDRPDWWAPVLFSRLKRGRTYYLPEFGQGSDATWRALADNVHDRLCTPVLGPGLAEAIIGSRQELARSWADLWQMPIPNEHRDDLVTVAQYLRVKVAALQPADELTRYLMRSLRERYHAELSEEELHADTPEALISAIGARRRALDDGDPFEIVASLELPIYVTTSWTSLLEDALSEAGREPIVRRFEWYAERDAPGEGDDVVPSVEHPLVLHLFGTIDDADSLVLSEDDYFAWLAAWNSRRSAILPTTVGKALTRRSLLFLGYRLDDWDFRVLFHSIKTFGGSAQLRKRPHVGVQLNPEISMIEPESAQEYLETYFGEDRVNIFWGDVHTFLKKLRERMDDRVAAGGV